MENPTPAQYLEYLKAHKVELENTVPTFKPQYGNKCKTQTLREIAEHSNCFEIEIHPNIIDELIQRERIDRANAFVKSKLAVLSAKELALLQLEVQGVLVDQEIERISLQVKDEVLNTPPSEVISNPTLDEDLTKVEVTPIKSKTKKK